MTEPDKYIIIRTFKRFKPKEAKKLGLNPRHQIMMAVYDEENDIFTNLVDALIERSKRDYPEDYIILPYW